MFKKLLKAFVLLLFAGVICILQISPCVGDDTVRIPILMYHHFGEDASNDMTVSPEIFDMHMHTLCDAGYTAITFDDLVAYVSDAAPLPENPVCITMDDGYLSNYEIAYPILQKYNMKATVFLIGSMSGRTSYPVTDYPLIPYFSWEQAKKMQDSGIIEIECHTYDLHHYAPYESGDRPIRENVLPLDGESANDYEAVLASDLARYIALSESRLDKTPLVLAYPSGKYTDESERIASECGFKVTLTTKHHNNIVRIGNENSLRLLGRHTITDSISSEELLKIIKP